MVRGDDGRENVFEAVGNNFGNSFVKGITKANGSEVFNGGRVWAFWDERNGGFVDFRGDAFCGETSLNKLDNIMGDNIPKPVIEEGVISVRLGGFVGDRKSVV